MENDEYANQYSSLVEEYEEKLQTLGEDKAELWFERAVDRLDKGFMNPKSKFSNDETAHYRCES